jgi:nitric oxide reductase subunit B
MTLIKQSYTSDKPAIAFLLLAMCYLLFGLVCGVIGGLQYILPPFLREVFSFQKSRPLHVYLVLSWIFTCAQGCMYYFIPRVAKREMKWPGGIAIHFLMQVAVSTAVISCFFNGRFTGREYLEFPLWAGILIIFSWIPFAVNFFGTLKPVYKNAPVYIWSWSTGILFFFITMLESYLWVFGWFGNNIVRDITVQWKALGSMVGSWNMLIYGTAMYVMERTGGDKKIAYGPLSFFFYFLGLTNLMFNWGHHTYVVPAAPWIKTTSYIISMTELLILGHIIFKWRKTLSLAQKNFTNISYRFLSFADLWIFLNLALAIIISIPVINKFTHGTHITVAHAMGATIGINTMLLCGGLFFILKSERPYGINRSMKMASMGLWITNIFLLFFWIGFIGSGLIKISGQMHNHSFHRIMTKSAPFFKLFTASGSLIVLGLLLIIIAAYQSVLLRRPELSDSQVAVPVREHSF